MWTATSSSISRGAYLWQNLLFYARFTAAPFTGLTDYSFELDDTGRPLLGYHLPLPARLFAAGIRGPW